jgi:hypothetical protein
MMMAGISTTAENEIKALLASWWTSVNQQIAAATGNEVQIGQDVPLELLFDSEVGQRLVRIASAAENLVDWSPQTAQNIRADCEAFEAWLNQTPVAHRTPEEFWNTPVGYLVLQARLWADQDQLISLKDAAELSGLSLSALSQRISRGQLKPYRDPHEPNPQRGRRIRLADLDQFMREGLLRKPGTTLFSKFAIPIQGIPPHQYQYQPAIRNTEQNQP